MNLDELEFISDKHLPFKNVSKASLCPEGGLQSDQHGVSCEAVSLFLFTLSMHLNKAAA